MAEKGKPFTDGEFIKNCLTIFTEYAFPDYKHLVEQTTLSRFTVSRRINDLSDNIKETLKDRLKSCEAFNLTLDESTDINDTAQLVIFIRAVTADFDIIEFSDMASLSSTTTGQDICEQGLKVVKKFEFNPAKLCCVTTDSAPSMTGMTNEFILNFLNAVGAQNVVVSHCILIKRTCVPSSRFCRRHGKCCQACKLHSRRGLNHRQFKTFLEELDSEYSDVVYFSAIRWLSRAVTLKRFWNLRQEIKLFMESKHQNVRFLSNKNWLNDLAFLTDITQHISDLILKLQEKGALVNKTFEHICVFEKKSELFQV